MENEISLIQVREFLDDLRNTDPEASIKVKHLLTICQLIYNLTWKVESMQQSLHSTANIAFCLANGIKPD